MSAVSDVFAQTPVLRTLGTAVCGALVGLGGWVGLAATNGWLPQRTAIGSAGVLQKYLPTSTQRRITVAGLIGAFGVAGVLRLPVLGLLILGAVWVGLDLIRGPSMNELNERGAGIAAWTETVRQELEAGQPQRAALIAACDVPPPGLEIPLGRLAHGLETTSIPAALWEFAREVRHPAAGHVVAALDVAYRYGAANLPKLMAEQVETTRHQVQMTREIHAARAKHRRTMILLLALFVTVVVALFLVWPQFLAAYRTLTGQMILLAIGVGVLISVRTLVGLSQASPPPDFFTGPAHDDDAGPGEATGHEALLDRGDR